VNPWHGRAGRAVTTLVRTAAVVIAVGAAWVAGRLAFPSRVTLPNSCPRPALLAHASNSLPKAAAALGRGFCGIEVDVQWRDGVGLVVAHDPLPATWSPTGSLTVAGLLDSLPQVPALLWLDFKNLSRRNAAPAATHLAALMGDHGLRGRVIVEARRPGALWLLRRRATAVIPAYWVPPRPQGLRAVPYDARLALVLGTLALPALSVPRRVLTPEFARRFRSVALFTWTYNTPEELRFAASLGARVILTDKNTPVIPAPPPGAVMPRMDVPAP
jgi:hypothetical protein